MARPWVIFLLCSCSPAIAVLGPSADPTDIGEPTPTAPVDPGPGAGAYRVNGEARAVWTDDALESTVVLELRDAEGAPLSGVEITVDGAGLTSDGGNTWSGSLATWDGSLDLRIDGPHGLFEARLDGPAPHQTTLPAGPWNVAEALTVTWSPAGATSVVVETDGFGEQALPSDSGTFTFAGGALAVGTEHVGVAREDTPDVAGAAPGSSFRVSVATIDTLPTIDPADPPGDPGSMSGELRVDSRWQNEVGTAWVTLSVDGVGFDGWTRIDGFVDREDYEILDLAPGDYTVVAYLDLDDSDEPDNPLGPTSGDPFVEDTVTITAGGTERLDLRMNGTF